MSRIAKHLAADSSLRRRGRVQFGVGLRLSDWGLHRAWAQPVCQGRVCIVHLLPLAKYSAPLALPPPWATRSLPLARSPPPAFTTPLFSPAHPTQFLSLALGSWLAMCCYSSAMCHLPQDGEHVAQACGDTNKAITTFTKSRVGWYLASNCVAGLHFLVGADSVVAPCSEPLPDHFVSAVCSPSSNTHDLA